MLFTFTKEPLHVDDVVVYLKNEKADRDITRMYKFIGQVIGFTETEVEIRRLSPPDIFVTPDRLQDLGMDSVYPEDVVYIVLSKYQEDSTTRTLTALNDIVNSQEKDIKLLIGKWFSALEDEGADPWTLEDCVEMAKKYWYLKDDYRKYLNTIV